MTTIAQVPFLVGYHWWRWVDETAGGRWPRGENSNYGLVRLSNGAYQELTSAFTQVNSVAPNLHEGVMGNGFDGEGDDGDKSDDG